MADQWTMVFAPAPLPPLPPQRRPQALRPGARVHVVAPGGDYDEATLQRGLAELRSFGLVPLTPPPRTNGVRAVYAAGHAARAAALRAAFDDVDCDAIWAVRGGSGTGRLLGEVEPALGRACAARPRWVVGFSDLTALHLRLQAHGCMSLHAANLSNLPDWTPEARQHLFSTLGLGGSGPETHAETPPAFAASLVQGSVPSGLSGVLVGGNLTVLASLCGTGAIPSWENAVVLLEDVAEAPYRLDRCLAQLVDAGALRGVRAVVFGQLTRCGQLPSTWALLQETLLPLGVPVLVGAPVGHEASSLPLVLGATVHFAPTGGDGSDVGRQRLHFST